MKKLLFISAMFFCFSSGSVNAQQKFFADEPAPSGKNYTGAHGPFYNGTVNDPTIPPRSAVPVGSLKGIRRNFTNKVIEGDTLKPTHKMVIGDDLQTTPKKQTVSKKKTKFTPKVW